MARRVFMHVGTPKTGTTYLQTLTWANKSVLQEQGLLLPLDRLQDHYFASNVVRGGQEALDHMPERGLAAWDRILDVVGSWDGDALVSHELFAAAWKEPARRATDQLAEVSDEVHVVVTARDLARQVPAEWQQTIKHGRTHDINEFYENLKRDDPETWFWRVQDLAQVLERWRDDLPRDRVHVVTVPPRGAPRGLLWERYAGLLGLRADSVDMAVDRPNESLGLAEVETLRRANLHTPEDAPHGLQQRLIRSLLSDKILAQRPEARKFAPPTAHHAWVVERGTQMVQALRADGYDVVGDLDELLPPAEAEPGPHPDDVDAAEIAEVAVESIHPVLFGSFQFGRDRGVEQGIAQGVERGIAQGVERAKPRLERKNHRIRELEAEVERLKRQRQQRDDQITLLQAKVQQARQMFRDERAQPLRVHLRRRAGLVKRKLLRQPLP